MPLRGNVTADRVLQGNQRFGGLYFIDGLLFVDQYMLQFFNRAALQLDENVISSCGVISFNHFIQCIQFGER